MANKLKFTVFDKDGKDVTNKNDWYVDNQGFLYFMTNDIDMPLMDASDYGYTYAIELVKE